jgi:hypothetical protein
MIGKTKMPRIRTSKPSIETPQDRSVAPELQPVVSRRSVRDPIIFVRAIAEIERVRGVRVHSESPTLH